MWTVEKTFRFEAAHRLAGEYVGKCNHLHGHSWVVRVKTKDLNIDKNSISLDFAEFKDLGKWIEDTLDHATIVGANDTELITWLTDNGQKKFIVDINPTSEEIAAEIFQRASFSGLPIESVTVEETCTCRCEYHDGTNS